MLLMLCNLVYLVDFFADILLSQVYGNAVISDYILYPASIAELLPTSWLLVIGVKNRPQDPSVKIC
ncbi:hypothetical protein COR50_15185 [Chitinophaga caeni]|uniref:Uncharacterized protein n=2 Tax=Chitinophaga caeni TaxID=2029983 RepID=A0A291QWI6_9BACT|nr:hypothetical protein [Chitinophaga caeni]ATL48399.1 hypothetical protein COR50_15185 [Chitinophaga caeni]